MAEDDELWPQPDRVGRRELEIVIGDEHISFTTSKIGSLVDVNQSRDPDGLRCFYYLVQVCIFCFDFPVQASKVLPKITLTIYIVGPQVPGVLPHRASFQDQAHLKMQNPQLMKHIL